MAASDLAARAMGALLAHEGAYLSDYARPMGAFGVRFGGQRLAHVGRAASTALFRVLEAAPAPVTWRGYLAKGAKTTRYAAPKRLEGAGRTTLTTALAGLRALPKQATRLYFKDGDPEALPPDRFAAYLSLAADHRKTFATGGGFLTCGFALDTLEDDSWIALIDELVDTLAAEVAWLGPAIWLAPHCLFNGSLNQIDRARAMIELFARDPQLDVPSWFASRYPFGFDELEPGPLAGLLVPSWVMWLDRGIARRVKGYRGPTTKLRGATRFHIDADPFAMTEAAYATWRARWAELAPIHLRHTDPNDHTRYYAGKLDAPTLAELGQAWRKANDDASARRARSLEIGRQIQQLAEPPSPALLAYADSVANQLDAHAAWYFLPALRELVVAGHASPGEALVWLDVCEQHGDDGLLEKMAAVAAAAGDHDRAIDLLRRGIQAHRIHTPPLARDPAFKALRKDPRFAKLAAKR